MRTSLLCVLLLVVQWVAHTEGAIPNEPPTFAGRNNSDIMFMYTFDAKECVAGAFANKVEGVVDIGGLNMGSGSSCNTVNSTEFDATDRGLTIARGDFGDYPDALLTGNSLVDVKTIINANNAQAYTIEIFFEFTEELLDGETYPLFEVGGLTPAGSRSLGTAADDLGLLIRYIKQAGDDEIEFLIVQQQGTNPGSIFLGQSTFTGIMNGLSHGKLYHFVMVLKPELGSNDDDDPGFYVSEVGQDFNSTKVVTADAAAALISFQLTFNDALHLRVGTSFDLGEKSSPVDVKMVSMYSVAMDVSDIEQNFYAGLPNSIPVARNSFAKVYEDTNSSVLLNETLTRNGDIAYYDEEGNPAVALVASLPSKGTLYYEGAAVVINETIIRDFDYFTYIQSTEDEITLPISNAGDACVEGVFYDQFDFVFSDIICQEPEKGRCQSNVATVNLCVIETNDAPIAQGGSVIVSEATNTSPTDLILKGSDTDDSSSTFGIRGATIVSQSQGFLGNLTRWNGTDCTDEVLELPYDFAINPGDTPAKDVVGDLFRFCYSAAIGLGNATTVIGNDEITFYVWDKDLTNSTTATIDVEVRNALLAGWGSVSANTFESYNINEDNDYSNDLYIGNIIYLSGFDAVNRPASDRKYIINTFPDATTEGRLYRWTAGNNLGTEITALDNEVAAETSGGDIGLGKIIFVPTEHYNNQYCLNADPVAATGLCPVGSFQRDEDLVGANLHGCTDPLGCPLELAFQIGIVSDSTVSPILDPGVKIWVTNVNDETWNITAPAFIKNMEKNIRYTVSESGPLEIQDYDEDLRVLGVFIEIAGTGAVVAAPDLPDEIFAPEKIRMITGETCYTSGNCAVPISFKAPLSYANQFLQNLEVTTTKTSGTDKLVIKVWDPVDDNNNLWEFNENTNPSAVKTEITLTFGESDATGPAEIDPTTQALIYAGISAGGLFVLLSCFKCFSGLCGRARRGEQAAVWIVENVLFTKVVRDKALLDEEQLAQDEGRMSIKRRKSLERATKGAQSAFEKAIDAEEHRLHEVLVCAHLLKCICPCCCRYANTSDIPNRDELMEVAVLAEREKVAQKHKPSDKDYDEKEVHDAMALHDDEEIELDKVADDSIFDWEKHIDEKTGRTYYYNPKLNKSSWTPPVIKVKHKKGGGSNKSVGEAKPNNGRFTPKPPTAPKPAGGGGNGEKDLDDVL